MPFIGPGSDRVLPTVRKNPVFFSTRLFLGGRFGIHLANKTKLGLLSGQNLPRRVP
jgi:hypothetical protein